MRGVRPDGYDPPFYILAPLSIILLGFIFGCVKPLMMNDLAIYIRWGECILKEGCEIGENPFNYTTSQEATINGVWLSEIIFYSMYRLGGWKLLQLFCGLSISLTLSILLKLLIHLSSRRVFPIFCALAFAFFLMIGNLGVRPQLLVLPLFSLTIYLLFTLRGSMREYLFFLLTTSLWANLHGSFILVMVTSGIFFIAEIFTERKFKFRSDWRGMKFIFSVFSSLLGSFINPYGPSLYRYIAINSRLPMVRGFTEWFPTTINNTIGKIFFISLFLLILLFIRNGRNVTWRSLSLFIFFSLFALSGVRMVIWYGIALSPILAENISSLYRADIPLVHIKGKKVFYSALFLLFILSIISIPWVRASIKGDRWEEYIDRRTPFELVQYLKVQKGGRAFNLMEWGSYLILETYPKFTFFTDPRAWLFNDEVWEEYIQVSRGDIEWERILDRYGVQYLILSISTHRNLIPYVMDSGSWREIYRDDKGVVFERISEGGSS